MSDADVMAALWLNMWTWEGLNEWINEGVEIWISEWMWEPREAGVNAPVDMQGIAEPEMPMQPL
jgi:hypothetical protein